MSFIPSGGVSLLCDQVTSVPGFQPHGRMWRVLGGGPGLWKGPEVSVLFQQSDATLGCCLQSQLDGGVDWVKTVVYGCFLSNNADYLYLCPSLRLAAVYVSFLIAQIPLGLGAISGKVQ